MRKLFAAHGKQQRCCRLPDRPASTYFSNAP
jgi:hypothetical protein